MQVLVSGATGFIGQSLCRAMLGAGHQVTGLIRQSGRLAAGARAWVSGQNDFMGLADSRPDLLRVDCAIHLAARVHVMGPPGPEALAQYRNTNVEGTLRVARAALQAGARRFVFVSSIKALGEHEPGRPWREFDSPQPREPYGISKLEAEQALLALGRETGLEIVVVRPPLVYGPHVRANFLQLMRAISRGLPLPLGAISARRSLIYVENLTSALMRCAEHPSAAGEVFHVADGNDLSVTELVTQLARQLHVKPWLLPVPPGILRFAGRVTGRSAQIERLVSPLRVAIDHIETQLGWQVPYPVEQGLLETANWYRATF